MPVTPPARRSEARFILMINGTSVHSTPACVENADLYQSPLLEEPSIYEYAFEGKKTTFREADMAALTMRDTFSIKVVICHFRRPRESNS